MKRLLYSSLLLLSLSLSTWAQSGYTQQLWTSSQDTTAILQPEHLEMTQEEIDRQLDLEDNFGMYRDNYFITGLPVDRPITSKTADAKFQLSIRYRMLKGSLPFHSYLMLTYTQKTLWDIYRKSAPFGDSGYNPGLMLVSPVVSKGRLCGGLALTLEHESNGRDGEASRSWNFLGLTGVYFYNRYFSVQGKVWLGLVSKKSNPDLLDYRGYGFAALNYRSYDGRFGASLMLTPTKMGVNTRTELSARFTRRANYHFFVQWEQGYAESLLDYKEYNSMVRIGIALKPALRTIY